MNKLQISEERIKQWQRVEFKTSTQKTSEFTLFSMDFMSYIDTHLPNNLVLARYTVGHFCVSGFITNKDTGKVACFNISDVRYFQNSWFSNVLYRTAKDVQDYSGGINHFAKLPDLLDYIEIITR